MTNKQTEEFERKFYLADAALEKATTENPVVQQAVPEQADIAPKSLTQEEMQRVLECLKMGLAARFKLGNGEQK